MYEYWIVNNEEGIQLPLVVCKDEGLRDKIYCMMHGILGIDCAKVKVGTKDAAADLSMGDASGEGR